ncbi:MAG TPA: 2-C-methyl-D-erythritol 4-phosphate cytidylyltransferase [Gammaproteobacteria bacterium]|nr:2-C-methyl-D-erythritol 4-phosphate cytidylyltransferase [Gammaproteobacteria bacterium]
MNQHPANIWGVLPAAGIGRRMGYEIPKQYLIVQGKSILQHSLQCLLSHPRINKVAVVVATHDTYWPLIKDKIAENRVLTVRGGMERCHSVHAGLLALAPIAQPDDWVLVHDAVRPCVRLMDIDRLISGVEHHATGGLLALAVRDTLKLTDEEGRVIRTMDRTGIWQAQTPQMFRLGELTAALAQAIHKGQTITDEAAAIELLGKQPLVIPGSIDNIKVTHPDDLLWLERYLEAKECV